ncbi:MAG: hypothetical protein ACLUDQ_17240 [Bilophila wadsworthia]
MSVGGGALPNGQAEVLDVNVGGAALAAPSTLNALGNDCLRRQHLHQRRAPYPQQQHRYRYDQRRLSQTATGRLLTEFDASGIRQTRRQRERRCKRHHILLPCPAITREASPSRRSRLPET